MGNPQPSPKCLELSFKDPKVYLYMLTMGFIYILTSPKGKSYIGQTTETVEKRWQRHVWKAKQNDSKPQCNALNNAIRKYGEKNFKVEMLLEIADEYLNEKEIQLIEEHNTLCPEGYNICKGGGGRSHDRTDADKDKISEAKRKHKDYDLPRGICEIQDKKKGSYGFLVKVNYKSEDGTVKFGKHYFLNSSVTMDQKYNNALDCYNKLVNGEEYKEQNKYKRNKNDNLDIPMYIVKRGDNGFAINKPGSMRKTFAHKKNSREQNLQNAIKYLESLNIQNNDNNK